MSSLTVDAIEDAVVNRAANAPKAPEPDKLAAEVPIVESGRPEASETTHRRADKAKPVGGKAAIGVQAEPWQPPQ